jgi:hypothetical protein
MTGRYFRNHPDFNAGPTEPKDVAIFLAKPRQNIKDIENAVATIENTPVEKKDRGQKERVLAQLRNEKEQKERVLAQLYAIDIQLSEQLRNVAMQTTMQATPEQALSWVESTLKEVESKYAGIDNLLGLGNFEAVYNTTYTAYEWIIGKVIEESENVELVQFLEFVLEEMDVLANKIAVYEECQRPMPLGTTNRKNKRNAAPPPENDWLKLLNGY